MELRSGQVFMVKDQGMCITPQTIRVTVHWASLDTVHYYIEDSTELRSTSLDRFLSIIGGKYD